MDAYVREMVGMVRLGDVRTGLRAAGSRFRRPRCWRIGATFILWRVIGKPVIGRPWRDVVKGKPRHVNVHINAVQQRAGEFAPIGADPLVGALATVALVAVIAARAGVHGGDQLEVCGITNMVPGATDDHVAALQRLS